MRKIISFMHVTLDGYVAGPNGELNWATVNQEIFDHVGRRVSKGDTALYGRVTYQMMESYWPTAADHPNATKHDIEHSAWYKKVRKVVLSKTLKSDGLSNTTIVDDRITERLEEIKQAPGEDIFVFGSPSATQALIKRNLIDGYWLFLNPVILGGGIPLFSGIQDRINLKLQGTHQFDCGVTELNYIVDKSETTTQ